MTDQDEEYLTYNSWSLRTYSGALREAVQSEMELAQADISQRMISKSWWSYSGADTAPFALYTRWQPGRVTIASIAGLGSQKGRVPIISAAFADTGLTVKWESVINKNLRYSLRRLGYQSTQQEPCPSADLFLRPGRHQIS